MRARGCLVCFAVALAVALAPSGCGDRGSDLSLAGPELAEADMDPAAPVRFTRDIEPILMSACSGEYCHGNFVNTPSRAYRFFVDQPSKECLGRTLVVPGRPEASYVMDKVRGEPVCAGDTMPRGAGNSLRPDQIQLLDDWIRAGARFD
jgi:hypothetical protein